MIISPYSGSVKVIAAGYDAVHQHLLNDAFVDCLTDPNSDYRELIFGDTFLMSGAERFGVDLENLSATNSMLLDYLRAVSIAQIHLRREGHEVQQLKQLVIKLFPPDDRNRVWEMLTNKIGPRLGHRETNFNNFMIDTLDHIRIVKESAKSQSLSQEEYARNYIHQFDLSKELSSGYNGFKITLQKAPKSHNAILGILSQAVENNVFEDVAITT